MRAKIEGCSGSSAAGSWMVGPPSSWSSRDQEGASWQAGSAEFRKSFSVHTKHTGARTLHGTCQGRAVSASLEGCPPPDRILLLVGLMLLLLAFVRAREAAIRRVNDEPSEKT